MARFRGVAIRPLVILGLLIVSPAVGHARPAAAQGAVTVLLEPVDGSGVSGTALLTPSDDGTLVLFAVHGLLPGTAYGPELRAGSCAQWSASFTNLPALTADAFGTATAAGTVLFHGTQAIALSVIADGPHIIGVGGSGGLLACGVIGPALLSEPNAGVTVTYAAGWNLVAFPPGTDLTTVAGPFYTWQPAEQSYTLVSPDRGLPANTGAWVYFTAPTTVVLSTGSTAPVSFGLIPQQWALLGDPSGGAKAVINTATIAYTYDPLNGYQPTQALLPGRGVWVMPEQGSHAAITITPLSAFGLALTSVSFTSPCGAALGTQGYAGEGNGETLGEVDGQPVTLSAALPQPYLPAGKGSGVCWWTACSPRSTVSPRRTVGLPARASSGWCHREQTSFSASAAQAWLGRRLRRSRGTGAASTRTRHMPSARATARCLLSRRTSAPTSIRVVCANSQRRKPDSHVFNPGGTRSLLARGRSCDHVAKPACSMH